MCWKETQIHIKYSKEEEHSFSAIGPIHFRLRLHKPVPPPSSSDYCRIPNAAMPWDRGLSITGYLPSADYLTQTVNRQVVVVLLLLCYHLWFQIHFSCPCGPPPRNLLHCYGYMLLPGCIIVCLLLWNDLRVGRFLRYSCHFISLERKRSRRKFCFQFLVCVLQASTSGLLWCASVLIDGDWYVCCGVADPAEARPSACVEEEMSRGQKNRRIHLKNQSMVSEASEAPAGGRAWTLRPPVLLHRSWV